MATVRMDLKGYRPKNWGNGFTNWPSLVQLMDVLFCQRALRALSRVRACSVKTRCSFFARLLGCVVLFAAGTVAAEDRPQIWFSFPPNGEFMKLFSSDADWPKTLRHIDVFELQVQFAVGTGDPTLIKIFQFLDRHHIALALEVPIQTPGPSQCGLGIEGYRPPGVISNLIKRFHLLGANLKYVVMDEPLWFGHLSKEMKAGVSRPCRAEIRDVAKNVATNIEAIRQEYPAVIIGDEEPLPNTYRNEVPPDYLDQMQRWMQVFSETTGSPLGFMHFDVGWFPTDSPAADLKNHAAWLIQLRKAIDITAARRMESGIYYNGNPQDDNGTAWVEHAEERFKEIEEGHHLYNNHVIFQTWMRQPTSPLPETTSGTMSNLVLRYLKFRHLEDR
jgi:hypothetical protein